MNQSLILWFQTGYAVWQFVRVTKGCRIPYGIVNSLLACLYFFFKNRSKVILPFQKARYTIVMDPGVSYYLNEESFDWYGVDNVSGPSHLTLPESDGLKFRYTRIADDSLNALSDYTYLKDAPAIRECRLDINEEKYSFLLKGTKETFLTNICRDKAHLFVKRSDMLIPGWSIVEPMDQACALNKIICEGHIPEIVREERVLPIWRVEDELNKNFTRILSMIPLVAEARGKQRVSTFAFFAILAIDQLGILFEVIHQAVKANVLLIVKSIISRIGSPQIRVHLCEFLRTFDAGLTFSDKYCHNFVRIKKGQEFLVCNTRAFPLNGEMGTFLKLHAPTNDNVPSEKFTRVDNADLKYEDGQPFDADSSVWLQYVIGKAQVFVSHDEDSNSRKRITAFCDGICVHTGFIEADGVFFMLNAMKKVAEFEHLPISFVENRKARCVHINDFISNRSYFLSIQSFVANKSMWVGG